MGVVDWRAWFNLLVTSLPTPMKEFLPFHNKSRLILWTLISTALNESCTGFTTADAMIKQISLPLFTHILRVLWRNLIIFAHNLIIFPLVLLVFWVPLPAMALLAIVGLVLLMLNLSWMALLLGVFCTRYRDVPQIIANLLQVSFYLTPINLDASTITEACKHTFTQCKPVFPF